MKLCTFFKETRTQSDNISFRETRNTVAFEELETEHDVNMMLLRGW